MALQRKAWSEHHSPFSASVPNDSMSLLKCLRDGVLVSVPSLLVVQFVPVEERRRLLRGDVILVAGGSAVPCECRDRDGRLYSLGDLLPANFETTPSQAVRRLDSVTLQVCFFFFYHKKGVEVEKN